MARRLGQMHHRLVQRLRQGLFRLARGLRQGRPIVRHDLACAEDPGARGAPRRRVDAGRCLAPSQTAGRAVPTAGTAWTHTSRCRIGSRRQGSLGSERESGSTRRQIAQCLG
ncbi:hypothetical protein M885DRAFT_543801 [Pelagophyceae sp. CCMP2097]|nr:hypothetical protein M885DRAFT_543801 [Pelagophyceae sp. CCMP2097]